MERPYGYAEVSLRVPVVTEAGIMSRQTAKEEGERKLAALFPSIAAGPHEGYLVHRGGDTAAYRVRYPRVRG